MSDLRWAGVARRAGELLLALIVRGLVVIRLLTLTRELESEPKSFRLVPVSEQ